jgi:hypothetical protein
MSKHTPNFYVRVKGMMTKKGADRVCLILAVSVLTGVVFTGAIGILAVVM